jgi:hypothetical protein
MQYLTHFKYQKIQKKKIFARTSSHITCAPSFFTLNQLVVWPTLKRQNFGAKNKTFYYTFFVFLHRPMSVFRETLGTHMYYRNVHVNFFLEFLDT